MGIKDKEKRLEGIRVKCRKIEILHSCFCCSSIGLFRTMGDARKAHDNGLQSPGIVEFQDEVGSKLVTTLDVDFVDRGKYKKA